VAEWNVPDAARLQGRDVRSRCGHADNVEAGLDERLELRAEKELETDVGGGDVRNQRPRARHVPALA
jgi:hypothetical protein